MWMNTIHYAIDVSFEGLIMIVVGIISAMAAIVGWLVRGGRTSQKHDDKLASHDRRLDNTDQTIKEALEKADKDHASIWQEIRDIRKEMNSKTDSILKTLHRLEGQFHEHKDK